MLFYKGFIINGSANTEVFDQVGLSSTEVEKKRLKEIWINVDTYQGNVISGYLEREKIIDEIKDYHFSDTSATSTKYKKIEVNLDIPVGQKFQVALKCGGTANNVYGVYVYEILK